MSSRLGRARAGVRLGLARANAMAVGPASHAALALWIVLTWCATYWCASHMPGDAWEGLKWNLHGPHLDASWRDTASIFGLMLCFGGGVIMLMAGAIAVKLLRPVFASHAALAVGRSEELYRSAVEAREIAKAILPDDGKAPPKGKPRRL